MFRQSLFALATLPLIVAPVTAEGLRNAHLSRQLYDAGVAQGDALLVLSAAKLRKGLDVERVERAPDGASADMDGPAPHLDWQAMLETAQELAGANDMLLGLIEDIRTESTKGLIGGRIYNITSLKSGGNHNYSDLEFEGKKFAEIYLEGSGRGDLNLFIYDDQNRLVCSDTDISRIAYCYWRPSETASFTAVVENKGPSAANYSLMSN